MLRAGLQVIAALGVVALASLVWLFVAPESLGGLLSASAVSGTSMQPTVRTGDLVVLEALDHYSVGDIVAYRNPAVAHTFLHRIVRVADGVYSMRGDRNRWLDPAGSCARTSPGRWCSESPTAARWCHGCRCRRTARPWQAP